MRAPGKETSPTKAVSVLDLVVLLGNLCLGNADKDVGFEDARMGINTIISKLNHAPPVATKIYAIENALWACNLLNEKGKFWHPMGIPFDRFVAKMLPDMKFDRNYNLIEELP